MNPEYDTLIDRYFATISNPEGMQVLGQIVHHTTDNLIVLGLFYDVEPMAIANRLVNVEGRTGELSSVICDAHLWDVL